MSVAFHRGLTHELILKMQLAGIRIEEIDAQRALAGLLTREVDVRGNPIKSTENQHAIRSGAAGIIERAVEEVLNDRFELMKVWENDHPGKSPFPPTFAETVIVNIEDMDTDADPNLVLSELLSLAREELLFG